MAIAFKADARIHARFHSNEWPNMAGRLAWLRPRCREQGEM
jgi:hypothetical protein